MKIHRRASPLLLAIALALASLAGLSDSARAGTIAINGCAAAAPAACATSTEFNTRDYDWINVQIWCTADCTGTEVTVLQRLHTSAPQYETREITSPAVPVNGRVTKGLLIVPWGDYTSIVVDTFAGTGPVWAVISGNRQRGGVVTPLSLPAPVSPDGLLRAGFAIPISSRGPPPALELAQLASLP